MPVMKTDHAKRPNIVTTIVHDDPDPREHFSWLHDVLDAVRDFYWRRHGHQSR